MAPEQAQSKVDLKYVGIVKKDDEWHALFVDANQRNENGDKVYDVDSLRLGAKFGVRARGGAPLDEEAVKEKLSIYSGNGMTETADEFRRALRVLQEKNGTAHPSAPAPIHQAHQLK